jgi:small subunit ribosomal protein S8
MSMSDPLGDMLTRIRNGQRNQMPAVNAPASRLRTNVLEVLKREGYIRDFEVSDPNAGLLTVEIQLKYHDGQPVIQEISRVSRPGRRVYSKIKELPRVLNGRAGHYDPFHSPRRHVRSGSTGCQCWRRSALPRVLRTIDDVSRREESSRGAQRRRGDHQWKPGRGQG